MRNMKKESGAAALRRNGQSETHNRVGLAPGGRKPKAPSFRPALLAGYSDLARLRHNYPLVLAWEGDEAVVRSLSDLIDETLRRIAPPGASGERLRCRALRLEEEIRGLVSAQGKLGFPEAWELAAKKLIKVADATDRDGIEKDLAETRAALGPAGDLIGCEGSATFEVVTHLWRGGETKKARAFLHRVDRLVYQLENMLEADVMSSPEAWEPDSLRKTMGGAFAEAFDFAALGGAIKSVACKSALPENRKRRVREALSALKSQMLFPREDRSLNAYLFDSLDAARQAHEARLDEIAVVLKAIGVAELELANRYREPVHDEALKQFDRRSLRPSDVAQFASSLVFPGDVKTAASVAGVLEVLDSALPMKVVLLAGDLLEEASLTARVADMAVALNETFVLQAASSQLNCVSEAIRRGMSSAGPALLHLFPGHGPGAAGLPPYLLAAAATESRAFPTFCFDPGAGDDWAKRFDVSHNPKPAQAWPLYPFVYEDALHQKGSEPAAFTWIDFAGCDERLADRFESVPFGEGKDDMLPAAEYLSRPEEGRSGWRPYVLAIDGKNRLWRRVPDEKLIASAARCARRWRSLQELGGIENSHAQRLLALEKARWTEEKEAEMRQLSEKLSGAAALGAPPAAAGTPAVGTPVEAPSPEDPAATDAPKSDEPTIETLRCTSCEECIKINNRIFAYNGNKQAFIADPDAGSYADLVRAAETCQVCIIHPGKPRNPDEPDLETLLKRAEPFL